MFYCFAQDHLPKPSMTEREGMQAESCYNLLPVVLYSIYIYGN